jgi:glyoxylase-like metal-dependent hydrolase (beta-lactamase superfamily II)
MDEMKKAPAVLKELAPGVYAFLQSPVPFASNAGLIVCKDYAVVVDTLIDGNMTEAFIKKIREVTDKPVRFVINTHWHGDHIYTNHYFTEASAICSDRTRKEILRLDQCEIETLSQIVPKMFTTFEGSSITVPDLTFDGTFSFHDGEREIRLIDLGPGHSQSDVVVYLPVEKILFAGDLLTPSLDGMTALRGGSYRLIEVLNTLVGFDAATFVPGHGGDVLGKKEVADKVRAGIESLTVMREEARKCFDQGMTYQEAADKIDYIRLQKWGDRKTLYGAVFCNVATAWNEFRGLPPGSDIDMEEALSVWLGGFLPIKGRLKLGMKTSQPTAEGT